MADITASVVSWSTTESSNQPTDSTSIGAGLDDNLRAIQAGTAREFAKGSDLPSASSVDIGASGTSGFVDITGTTTITSLGTARAGTRRWVRFTGSLTLTHNATSLILPGGANITTAAGDVALFISLGSGNWVCAEYPTVFASATIGGGANSTAITATTDSRTSSTTALPQALITNTTNDATGPSAATQKSRASGNTSASDALYTWTHQGYASSAYRTAVLISIIQDGAVSGTTVPGAWILSTQAAGGSLNENLRVDSTGCVRIGAEAAAGGYTLRGDVTLPAARAVRAKNTLKAWVVFDGTGSSPITPLASFNVTDVTKNATGDYTVNFTNAMANANYCAVGMAGDTSGSNVRTISGPRSTAPTTTAFRLTVSDTGPTLRDAPYIYLMVAGE